MGSIMRKVFIARVCPECSLNFLAKSTTHKFCSQKCFLAHSRIFRYEGVKLPAPTMGALSELVVSADLLSKGFEVFRALTSSCSCDLAILKNGKLSRIEVKTAYKNNSGKYVFANGRLDADNLRVYANTKIKADILALYIRSENKIIYQPKLELPSPAETIDSPKLII